jgi:hypothetical protein
VESPIEAVLDMKVKDLSGREVFRRGQGWAEDLSWNAEVTER